MDGPNKHNKKNIAYTPLPSNSTRDLMTVSALARHVMNSTQLTLALGKLTAKLSHYLAG